MKIEKISDNKIRVTISLDDLEERNIDLNSLNYNSPAAQELFWDMMEQAEIQFGFNASDSQLVFEMVPDSNEGFIITMTKLDADGDFESIRKYVKNLKRNDLRVKKRTRKILSPLMIYSFDSFEDLCALSNKIYSIYHGESTLYKYKETYYLLLLKSNIPASASKMFDSMICEYGTKIMNQGFYEGYLNEHGTKLIENNALEIIKNYF